MEIRFARFPWRAPSWSTVASARTGSGPRDRHGQRTKNDGSTPKYCERRDDETESRPGGSADKARNTCRPLIQPRLFFACLRRPVIVGAHPVEAGRPLAAMRTGRTKADSGSTSELVQSARATQLIPACLCWPDSEGLFKPIRISIRIYQPYGSLKDFVCHAPHTPGVE